MRDKSYGCLDALIALFLAMFICIPVIYYCVIFWIGLVK